MSRASGTRVRVIRTGMSLVLALAMATGSVPTDNIAYAEAASDSARAAQPISDVLASETENVATSNKTSVSALSVADATSTDSVEPRKVTVHLDANGGEVTQTISRSSWMVVTGLSLRTHLLVAAIGLLAGVLQQTL